MIRRRGVVSVLVAAMSVSVVSLAMAQESPAREQPASIRAVDQWNIEKKTHLAIEGYDPVAYFPEGGGKATKGRDSVTSDYRGVTYRFASDDNKARFDADPSRYEPSYGGWCSWAMIDGEKVEIDPTSFIVKDGRLFLFYNGFIADTRAKWLKGDHATESAKADASWKKLTGESRPVPGGKSLKTKLDAKSAEFSHKAPAELMAAYEQGIRDVADSGVLASALKVGDHAPDFELPDARGGTMSLKTMLAKGPVVLTWYRGGWCPYCNLQLQAYQEALQEMEGVGGQLVAISPQTPEYSLSTAEKDELSFAVVSDAGNKVAKMYGVAYKLPDKIGTSLEQGVGLSKRNGDTSMELPLAVTYVIATDGTIKYAYVDADYRKRAEPEEIVSALRAIHDSGK